MLTEELHRISRADSSVFSQLSTQGSPSSSLNLVDRSFLPLTVSAATEHAASGLYFSKELPSGTPLGDQDNFSELAVGDPYAALPIEVDLGSLNGTYSRTGTINSQNAIDVYRFTLDTAGSLNLSLTGLAADLDFRLVQDSNSNGLIDIGEELARSQHGGTADEAINFSGLAAGTYFVQIYQFTGDTSYTLNLSTATPSNLLPSEINVGSLGKTQTFSDLVSNTDAADVYRVGLTETSDLYVNLAGLNANVGVRLIQDLNGNGLVDDNEVLTQALQPDSNSKLLSATLQAGTYYVQVVQYSGNTNYTLSFSTTPPTSTPDNAGNTLTTANDIGILNGSRTLSDFVGSSDINDYYRLVLDTTSTLSLSLDGLTADADTQLIQDLNGNGIVDSGEVLAYPWQSGTAAETLTVGLAAGTYFIRVFQYSGDTNYTLSVSASELTLPQGYSLTYGYGLVDASAAVAQAIGQSPFPQVADLGGVNWDLDLINAPEVWAKGYTGAGVIVAVVDSGVDYTHPDLSDNIWTNPGEIPNNGIDDDGNGYIDDVHGWDFVDNDSTPLDLNDHGTHVAGTIAAENNGVGATGVAYDATIMPVRVLDANGSGDYSDIAAGIRYAVDNGARVINLSLGGGYASDVIAAIQYAAQQGAVVVMAAGNESAIQPTFPASEAVETGIAVGAVDRSNHVANFSNDAGAPPISYVAAPGVSIYSTTPNNTYQSFSGTSMATPHVSGVAALILSANPNLTPAEVTAILTGTANPNGVIA